MTLSRSLYLEKEGWKPDRCRLKSECKAEFKGVCSYFVSLNFTMKGGREMSNYNEVLGQGLFYPSILRKPNMFIQLDN